jgi:hypothetical protein
MIQIFFEAIFPALLAAGLAVWGLIIAGRLASHRIALWAVQRRYAIKHNASRIQAAAAARDAIAATLTELASRPATYSTFPPDVLALLHDAQTRSPYLDTIGDHQ